MEIAIFIVDLNQILSDLYQILRSVVAIVIIVEHILTVQKLSTINTIIFSIVVIASYRIAT